jgi:hypothetical protein
MDLPRVAKQLIGLIEVDFLIGLGDDAAEARVSFAMPRSLATASDAPSECWSHPRRPAPSP